MAKLGLAIVFTFFINYVHSQQPGYVVLIDADKEQVFHVRIGDTIYMSSSLGHMSIPHLKDSTYSFAIGFPKSQYRDRVFSVKVNKKDLGFQLKNEEGKGWVLYNWQTRETKMPLVDSTSRQFEQRGVKKDDAFTRLMAAVVNDTSVMYNAFVATKENSDSTGHVTSKKDSLQTGNPPNSNPVVAASVTAPKKQKKAKKNEVKEGIQKMSEVFSSAGLRITYVEVSKGGKTDTINLLIPQENEKPVASVVNDTTIKVATTSPKKKNKKSKSVIDSSAKNFQPNQQTNPNVQRPDCKSVATDYDVDVLRVNILTENSEPDKIGVANKAFKSKCYTVKQLRALTELFSNDKARYSFFQSAYPYTYDRENFGQLSDMVTDKEFTTKFHQDFP